MLSTFLHFDTSQYLISYNTGSVFWSTLVSWVNGFARLDSLPKDQQNYLSVIILLMFLLILPFIFDTLARNYEGMKLESEIQNTIMTRCVILYLHGLSCLALPCLAMPCLALPCLALPCLALPCLALPCLALPCLALPCLALPCLPLPCHTRFYYATGCKPSVLSVL